VEHWLFIQAGADGAASRQPACGTAERANGTSVWVSTLLGPEEAAASWDFLERPVVADLRMEVRDTWFRPYLENYTVDASIFCKELCLFEGRARFCSSLHVVHAVSSF